MVSINYSLFDNDNRLGSTIGQRLCEGRRGRGGKHTIYRAIIILVGLTDHLVDFLIGQVLAKRLHDLAKLVRGDCATAVFVEDVEGGAGFVCEIRRFDCL